MGFAMSSRKVLRPADIAKRVGCGQTAAFEAVANELLPALFKVLGSRAKGCFEHELDEVLDARAAGASDDDIRAIVSRQIERRKARFDELRSA